MSIIAIVLIFISQITLAGEMKFTTNSNSLSTKDSLRISAKIVGITDGDSVDALYNGELLLKIRLAHIDAPEKRGNQPFWQKSKQKLSDLCFGQIVILTAKLNKNGTFESDRNGRMIATIYNQNQENVNMQMVKSGMAWHFKKYSADSRYHKLEQQARQSKLGIWSDKNPIPPHDFRNP
ncbi:MAG: thermonuclease family protein [Flavobacteriaceae bacterium]|nr:thermonuclease family protein [Flavobacteriaceae bacterium]